MGGTLNCSAPGHTQPELAPTTPAAPGQEVLHLKVSFSPEVDTERIYILGFKEQQCQYLDQKPHLPPGLPLLDEAFHLFGFSCLETGALQICSGLHDA